MSEKKKYPEYRELFTTTPEEQEACWQHYAERITRLRAKGVKYTFPIDKNSYHFIGGHYGFHKAMIVKMKPKEFLALAQPKAHINVCSLDYLLDAFEFGEPQIPPLTLRINADRCDVIAHNGRHRAEIANDLGVEEIPVILDFAPNYTLPLPEGYDLANEFEDRWRKNNFKKSAYDDALELMGDKWQEPKGCIIEVMASEGLSIFEDIMREREEIIRKRAEKRKEVGLNHRRTQK